MGVIESDNCLHGHTINAEEYEGILLDQAYSVEQKPMLSPLLQDAPIHMGEQSKDCFCEH